MNSLGKVSDEEVSSSIRYLDPDFHDAFKSQKRTSRSSRWVVLGFVLVSTSVVLYIAALRYLPAVMRLLN
jgi:hypothetical protein